MKIITVIPTFNRVHTLKRALDSVRLQVHPSDETIVVDDASTDKTAEFLNHYSSQHTDFNLKVLKNTENKGVSFSRNRAIRNALEKHGKDIWIALLDSDDEWLPEKLEKQIECVNEFPDAPLIHGEEIWIRNGKRVNQMKKHKKSGGRIFSRCLPLCCVSPSASLIHGKIFEECGLFREDFPVCEDYDLWLKITCRYEVGFIETPIIIKHGGHKDQLSRKLKAMDFWRVQSMLSISKIYKDHLSSEESHLLSKELKRKTAILEAGYMKHNNYEGLKTLHDLLN